MGKLCVEDAYRNELKGRCAAAEMQARHELQLKLTHGGFAKSYFIDLVASGCVPIECKTALSLTSQHKSQLLNYLLIAGVNHGLLLNFRTNRVQKYFVSTTLTPATQREFAVTSVNWQEDLASNRLKEFVLGFAIDFGVFLEVALYREAIEYFLGGPTNPITKVPLSNENGIVVGHQRVCLLDQFTAVAVTCLNDSLSAMQSHLERLLTRIPIRRFQWINFGRHSLTFTTIT